MNESLNQTAKQVGTQIIDLAKTQTETLESWFNESLRPNELSSEEVIGFKSIGTDSLQLIVDVIAPLSEDYATLRLWAIRSYNDANGTERFNNIQLNFTIPAAEVRTELPNSAAVTVKDFKTILDFDTTTLSRIIVSDETGVDEKTGEKLGQRIDTNDEQFSGEAIATLELTLAKVIAALNQ